MGILDFEAGKIPKKSPIENPQKSPIPGIGDFRKSGDFFPGIFAKSPGIFWGFLSPGFFRDRDFWGWGFIFVGWGYPTKKPPLGLKIILTFVTVFFPLFSDRNVFCIFDRWKVWHFDFNEYVLTVILVCLRHVSPVSTLLVKILKQKQQGFLQISWEKDSSKNLNSQKSGRIEFYFLE